MTERASALVTILFTDLVNSTELLARAGDEEAQRVFRAHHDLLTKAAAAHGGQEVKWLGDGLMVAFPSAVDAVRCAVAMQDESRRPIQGERLAIRVGLNAGETIRDEADYFGLPVVIARRLCDRADAGQILCTEVIAGLLVGRAGFAFSDLGKLELKGVPDSVGASEVRYEVAPPTGIPSRTHLVGREAELSRLTARLRETAAGSGGLVVVAPRRSRRARSPPSTNAALCCPGLNEVSNSPSRLPPMPRPPEPTTSRLHSSGWPWSCCPRPIPAGPDSRAG